jgi:ankyrin repeat protein
MKQKGISLRYLCLFAFMWSSSLSLGFLACANLRNSEGKTPLYRAAEQGDLQEVRKLVEQGADINSSNLYLDDGSALTRWIPSDRFAAGFRPLHVAVEKGHIEVAKYLLVNDADVNARTQQGQTPLFMGAASAEAELVELLVENGAEIDPVDQQGVTPLSTAARNGHVPAVRLLLSKGALVDRPDHDGRTALHYASEKGSNDVVKLLLEGGADPNQPMKDGQTALQAAILAGHEDIAAMLLEKGADPNLHAPGTTPLLIAAAYNGHQRIVSLLLEEGANVDVTSEGWTAMHHAAVNNHADIIPFLVRCGADVNRQNAESNQTPLQLAVEENAIDVVRALLENGADPDRTVTPLSPPLARAAREGYLEIVKLLITFEADVNIQDGNWTPLRYAEFGNHDAVVELLREHGAVTVNQR